MTVPRLARIARQRLRSLAQRSELDTELERELAFHFDALVGEKIAGGLAPDEARRAARREIGNLALFQEQCRDQRRVNWFHDIRQDVGYGLRILRKTPTFTVVVVMSLALGIGANSAVLGVMNAVWRDALPLPDADRLVAIRGVPRENPSQLRGVSAIEYLAAKERSRSFDAIGLTLSGPRELGAEADGTPAERTTGQAITPDVFTLLGVQPALGRVFTDAEALPDNRVVILSYRLWQRRYGGDPAILNRQIPVDRAMRTVVGVMPEDYVYGDPRVDFWTPMFVARNPSEPARTRADTPVGRAFGAVARLKPGVTIEQAQAELGGIALQLGQEFPVAQAGWDLRVQSLRELLFGWTRQPLVTLQVAVALVLVIACANVAALLLSRASVRQREIAMRVALGAGRMRIVRQLLTESVLLSLAGGALGLLIAWWGVRGLTAMSPPIGSPRIAEVSLDLRIIALTGLLSVLTGIIFGLAPALLASQSSPGPPLKEPDGSAAMGTRHTIRTVLVTAQLALALILLIGFGLLINSFVRLSGRNLNFDPVGLLTFEFRTDVGQQQVGVHRGQPFFEITGAPSQKMKQVLERLQTLSGVESAGGSSVPAVNSLIVPMANVTSNGTASRVAYFLVTPNFFHTMRTPFVRGRDVSDADTSSRPWVAIVNETAARQFWPGEDPIGRTLTIDGVPEEQPREVIGIVRDIPTRHGQVEPQPIVYTSYLQQPSRYAAPFGGGMFGQMTFAVRHRSDPLSLVPAVRKAVGEIESRPISSVTTEEQRFQYGMQRMRYNLFLVGVLACTAAVLAMVGVYGMLAYSVSLRTREIGIRKALGAGTGGVVAFVGRYVLTMIAAGVAIGVAGAAAFSRLIASQLWGITPTDPTTFAVVSLVLVTAALLACVGPTRRAIAVDPTVALRCE